jgi:23S rRNA maturation-related 3'-5' exoribonuclease YhaM
MSHELIGHQTVGNRFQGIYYVESVYVKKTVQNKDYTDMMLRDKSGARPVKYWGVVKDLARGNFVFFGANVEDYQGNPSIIAKNVEVVEAPEELDDYMPEYDGLPEIADKFDALQVKVAEIGAEMNDKTCSVFIEEIFRGGSFFEKFSKCPGSDTSSYGKVGGLMARTVQVASHTLSTCETYKATSEEKLIAVTAALVSMIGAADSYEFIDCLPKQTNTGILLGTHSLTMTRITSALRRVVAAMKKENEETNHEILLRVMHAVAASNANSGIVPMTKDAMILAGAMKLDAEVAEAADFIENDQNKLDEFTAYNANARRRYYKG